MIVMCDLKNSTTGRFLCIFVYKLKTNNNKKHRPVTKKNKTRFSQVDYYQSIIRVLVIISSGDNNGTMIVKNNFSHLSGIIYWFYSAV